MNLHHRIKNKILTVPLTVGGSTFIDNAPCPFTLDACILETFLRIREKRLKSTSTEMLSFFDDSSASSSYLFFTGSGSRYVWGSEMLLFVGGVLLSLQEFRGAALPYSKFAGRQQKLLQVPSKIGMLMFYVPAAILSTGFLLHKLEYFDAPTAMEAMGLSGWAYDLRLHNSTSLRIVLVSAALTLHFVKRVLEVNFLHEYSGTICGVTSLAVSVTFALLSLNLFYAQEISEAMCYQPAYNTMWLGLLVFMVGIVGNFYHHCILARIRNSAEGIAATSRRDSITTKKYIIPHGGLFDKVACPQYLFEIISFIGIAMISQTTMSLACAVFVILYLTARSVSTRDWYVQKLEGFPRQRKALVPNIL